MPSHHRDRSALSTFGYRAIAPTHGDRLRPGGSVFKPIGVNRIDNLLTVVGPLDQFLPLGTRRGSYDISVKQRRRRRGPKVSRCNEGAIVLPSPKDDVRECQVSHQLTFTDYLLKGFCIVFAQHRIDGSGGVSARHPFSVTR